MGSCPSGESSWLGFVQVGVIEWGIVLNMIRMFSQVITVVNVSLCRI